MLKPIVYSAELSFWLRLVECEFWQAVWYLFLEYIEENCIIYDDYFL